MPAGVPAPELDVPLGERAERDAFLDAVRRAPAQLRALLAELDGAVDVVGGSEACLSVDACEEVHGDRATVGMAVSASREVIVHELGHVVFDLALDERGPTCISIGLHPHGLGEGALTSPFRAVRRPARALGARRASPPIRDGCHAASSRACSARTPLPPHRRGLLPRSAEGWDSTRT